MDLFIDASKLSDVKDYISSINVTVHPYDGIKDFIASMPQQKVTIDPKNCNMMLYNALKEAKHQVLSSDRNIVELMKANKNLT